MSTYRLRNRTIANEAGDENPPVVAIPSVAEEANTSSELSSIDGSDTPTGTIPGGDRALYSRIVSPSTSGRSLDPARENSSIEHSEPSSLGNLSGISNETPKDIGLRDDDPRSWTEVHHGRNNRRARSFDASISIVNRNKFDVLSPSEVSSGQFKDDLIHCALANMTQEELQKYANRTNNVRLNNNSDSDMTSEHVEFHEPVVVPGFQKGSSNLKGKTIDPKNWGAAGLDSEDLDLEKQQATLDNWKAINNARHHEEDMAQ
ncbi:hypothetical protein C8J56DRAFT_1038336 [Mycena floridula]|nr:hypothetical protein C8J56DRAFT_1038336 [Mycena floridula]